MEDFHKVFTDYRRSILEIARFATYHQAPKKVKIDGERKLWAVVWERCGGLVITHLADTLLDEERNPT